MSTYTVRVELHYAGDQEYQQLHADMEAAGYARTIRGDFGRTDHMPTAMYDLPNSPLAIQQVLSQVAAIARRINPTAWVFVDEPVRRAWITEPVLPSAHTALAELLGAGVPKSLYGIR